MNYKEKLYTDYYSIHIAPRKGKATLNEFKQRAVSYQKHFGRLLPKDKKANIIDIGCGNGSVVWWLQQNGFSSVAGIDISAEQIAIAFELGVKNVRQADIHDFFSKIDRLYDTIILRDVIEHFEKKEILDLLNRCYGALNEHGSIIIQVPNAESPFGSRMRYGDFTHEVSFTSTSLTQVLRASGFEHVFVYSVVEPIASLKSLIRYSLWKVVEALYQALLMAELGRGKRFVTQNIIAYACKQKKAHA
jgi:2-polyprenyl-3-methyl-5-hydroxy-6-metoxy-1,4-benzoquinol methylase